MLPVREFKAAVRRAALSLPAHGFTFSDLAHAMGGAHIAEGPERARLASWRDRALNNGGLVRIGRGRYVAGPATVGEGGLGVGVQLVADIHDAFIQAGGVLEFGELLVELNRDDGRLVRRVLDESPRYSSGTPVPGFRRAWTLADAERLSLPVPGRLIAFDLQMAAGGRIADLPRALARRRVQIGEATAQARDWRGLTEAQIVAVPAVANALDSALRASDLSVHSAEGAHPLADWWRDLTLEAGRADALAELLAKIEAGDQLVQLALTCRAWSALGRALGVSPAFLSRGVVAGLRIPS